MTAIVIGLGVLGIVVVLLNLDLLKERSYQALQNTVENSRPCPRFQLRSRHENN